MAYSKSYVLCRDQKVKKLTGKQLAFLSQLSRRVSPSFHVYVYNAKAELEFLGYLIVLLSLCCVLGFWFVIKYYLLLL